MQENGKNRAIRALDIVIIALIAAITAASAIAVYGRQGNTTRLTIEAPTGSWMYDLSADRTVKIPGKLGDTVVVIAEGAAKISESPCPNQICVAAPAISKPGEWTACLPNEVIIRVTSQRNDSGIDAIVY